MQWCCLQSLLDEDVHVYECMYTVGALSGSGCVGGLHGTTAWTEEEVYGDVSGTAGIAGLLIQVFLNA